MGCGHRRQVWDAELLVEAVMLGEFQAIIEGQGLPVPWIERLQPFHELLSGWFLGFAGLFCQEHDA